MDSGRVLVVDDNRLNRFTLSQYLGRQGYTVVLAENGQQALELVRSQPFDLMLLDIVMPVMDGYQVLEHIRADPTLRSLPVIVISALEEMESIIRCIGMGAADYLPKPFDPVLLQARIGACLENKRLHDQEVSFLAQIQREKKRADDLLNLVIPLGVALAGERDMQRLLNRAVTEAMSFCNAEAGWLYLRTTDDKLEAMITHRGTSGDGSRQTPLVSLYDPLTGKPNQRAVVARAAVTGQIVHVTGISQSEEFDCSDLLKSDVSSPIDSLALLAIPLKNSTGEVIGVLQLLNARNPATGKPLPFDDNLQQLVGSFSQLAAVAVDAYVREQRLRQEIQQLRIDLDEARQARQVAEITETEYFRQLQARASNLRKAHHED